jgi:FAD/FMN-containing dehydrogenase
VLLGVFERPIDRRATSDLLSAFEFLMPPAMEIAVATQADAPALSSPAGVFALIELAAPGPVDLQALLEGYLAEAATAGLVLDAILATSEAQSNRIWALRESVNEGQARMGPFLRSDVSVLLSALPRFLAEACAAIEAVEPGLRAIAYGHFGDGNVHLNVLPPPGADSAGVERSLHRAKEVLNDCLDRHSGSISAEHGIGRIKRADFDARLHGPARSMLRGLKSTLDPEGRMNPGALHV